MRRLTLLWIVWSRGGMTMLISIRTWRNSRSIWIMVPRCRVIAHSLSDAWLNLAIRQVYVLYESIILHTIVNIIRLSDAGLLWKTPGMVPSSRLWIRRYNGPP